MKEKNNFIGAILVDKPAGITSHDVVGKLRYLLKQQRIGHTGTLDPFATGLLLICLGKATRLVQFLTSEEKEYEAVIRFGFSTNTQDYTGKPNSPIMTSYGLKDVDLDKVFLEFLGEQEQIPPMFSAKKIGGETLHHLARKGQEVERKAVKIFIYNLELMMLTGENLHFNPDGTCDIAIRVKCSAGTYIRTLAEDLGNRLGYGAHLISLRRTSVGKFLLSEAKTLEEISEIYSGDKQKLPILTPAQLIRDLPKVKLPLEEIPNIRNGKAQNANLFTELRDWVIGAWIGLLDSEEKLIAMAQMVEEDGKRKIQPRILLID
ncbi:MAG: tRNA pseudouridine(55) synthase TruB [Acidobacteria bacterium]|nr:tRNA pseudouridine(55) synthase TruB [Acidobacteriota bacterium]